MPRAERRALADVDLVLDDVQAIEFAAGAAPDRGEHLRRTGHVTRALVDAEIPLGLLDPAALRNDLDDAVRRLGAI